MSAGPGKWAEQKAQGGPLSVLNDVRTAIHDGRFVRQEWDPKNPNYRSPFHNKRIGIAASALLGRAPIDADEAWNVVITAAIGPRP